MGNVTYAYSKSFPRPSPRLCAKQSSIFIKNELQILQSKDSLYRLDLWQKKPTNQNKNQNYVTRLQPNITISTEEDVNLDSDVTLTPALSFPFKLHLHQQDFTFLGLQVPLASP